MTSLTCRTGVVRLTNKLGAANTREINPWRKAITTEVEVLSRWSSSFFFHPTYARLDVLASDPMHSVFLSTPKGH